MWYSSVYTGVILMLKSSISLHLVLDPLHVSMCDQVPEGGMAAATCSGQTAKLCSGSIWACHPMEGLGKHPWRLGPHLSGT